MNVCLSVVYLAVSLIKTRMNEALIVSFIKTTRHPARATLSRLSLSLSFKQQNAHTHPARATLSRLSLSLFLSSFSLSHFLSLSLALCCRCSGQTHKFMSQHTHTQALSHTHTHIHEQTHTHTHTHTHVHRHSDTEARARTYVDTQMTEHIRSIKSEGLQQECQALKGSAVARVAANAAACEAKAALLLAAGLISSISLLFVRSVARMRSS